MDKNINPHNNLCYYSCNWKEHRLRYMMQNKKVLYLQLKHSGELYAHLESVSTQADELYKCMVNQIQLFERTIELEKEHNISNKINNINYIHASIIEYVYKKIIYK